MEVDDDWNPNPKGETIFNKLILNYTSIFRIILIIYLCVYEKR